MVQNTIDVINMTNLRQACSILNIIVRHLHDFLNVLIYRQEKYYIKHV